MSQTTYYSIKYKIVEGKTTYSGQRLIDVPVDEYIKSIRKQYPEATYTYLELLDTIVKDDFEDEFGDGQIILCLNANITKT